jgi:hypothetical protein
MAKINDLDPKPFWKLPDYVEAVQRCLNDRMVEAHEDKNAYATDVVYRIAKTKKAIENLEKFMKDEKIT